MDVSIVVPLGDILVGYAEDVDEVRVGGISCRPLRVELRFDPNRMTATLDWVDVDVETADAD